MPTMQMVDGHQLEKGEALTLGEGGHSRHCGVGFLAAGEAGRDFYEIFICNHVNYCL